MSEFDYWLISEERSNRKGDVQTVSLALVRCGDKCANAVAGDKTLARDYERPNTGAFVDAKPNIEGRPGLIFEYLGKHEPQDSAVQDFIDELGPPFDRVKKRLAMARKRSRARALIVTPEDLSEMKRLRINGLSYSKIGVRLGFSEKTIRNYLSGRRRPLPLKDADDSVKAA